jgi:hypothetical protein
VGGSGTAIIAARSRCAKASPASKGDKITDAIQPPLLPLLQRFRTGEKSFVKRISPVAHSGCDDDAHGSVSGAPPQSLPPP